MPLYSNTGHLHMHVYPKCIHLELTYPVPIYTLTTYGAFAQRPCPLTLTCVYKAHLKKDCEIQKIMFVCTKIL